MQVQTARTATVMGPLVFLFLLRIAGAGVDLLVPSEYETIQDAVDAALTGDQIIVADNTYTGPGNRDIDFRGKAITLRSENGPAACIIDCQATEAAPHRAFYFHSTEDANSMVEGFTITGGYNLGGGVLCENSSPIMVNCIITGNTSPGRGGGVYCSQSNAIFRDCTISSNSSNIAEDSDGGGMACTASAPLFERCTITANETWRWGGAVYCYDSTLTIVNSKINGNFAGYFGGGLYTDLSTLSVNNCTICANYAHSYGGGFYCDNSSVANLTNCAVADNTAAGLYGGGLRCYNGTTASLINCIVWNNSASYGPQIALALEGSPSNIDVSYSDIEGGYDDIYREIGCVVNWLQGNLELDPVFVQSGYWDTNQTPDDTSDDIWTDGNYHLASISPCINAGDNSVVLPTDVELDLNRRLVNDLVDLGPYETSINITKIKVQPLRTAGIGSVNLSGEFDATVSEFLDAPSIQIQIGPYLQEPLDPVADFQPNKNLSKYTYRGAAGAVTLLKIDFSKKSFMIVAKELDLPGLTDPVAITFDMGHYQGLGFATVGPRPLSLRFLSGISDTLRVDKTIFRPGRSPGTDSLIIQGAIAVQDMSLALDQEEITVQWGSFVDSILAGSLVRIGSTPKYVYRKPKNATGFINGALFDLDKCFFKIQIKNADIGTQPTPVQCSITFGSYAQTTWVYP